MARFYQILFSFLVLNAALIFPAVAEESHAIQTPAAGLPPIQDSKAYKQFILKPTNELSKLIYLVDRFGESKIEIQYEDHYYSAAFVGKVVRIFLATHYSQETAEHWISEWAVTSIPSGKPIWAKFPDGNFKLARELFREELKALDQTLKEHPPICLA